MAWIVLYIYAAGAAGTLLWCAVEVGRGSGYHSSEVPVIAAAILAEALIWPIGVPIVIYRRYIRR